MDVIGVGGIDFEDNIARFSSRGMTTWVSQTHTNKLSHYLNSSSISQKYAHVHTAIAQSRHLPWDLY